jgi:ribosomal protein S18 acetylase RimI-like enzyme
MNNYRRLRYRTGDLSRLVEFILRIRKPERLSQYPRAVDLEELLDTPRVRTLTSIWQADDKKVAGYALIDPRYCNLLFEVDPVITVAGLQEEMIDWGIAAFKQLKIDGKMDQNTTLDTNCDENDSQRITLLKSSGFIPQDLMTLHLERPLNEPIPSVKLPAGFMIRSITGEQEVDDVVSLYHAAYGTESMTREEALSIMRTTDYDREFDLLAISPEGRIAGLCTCGMDKALNEKLARKTGWTDPVLVHPEYQGLGLSRALICRGWELLCSRGAEMAELGTSSHNEKGIAAFTHAGYRIVSRWPWFSHPVA